MRLSVSVPLSVVYTLHIVGLLRSCMRTNQQYACADFLFLNLDTVLIKKDTAVRFVIKLPEGTMFTHTVGSVLGLSARLDTQFPAVVSMKYF